MNSFAALQTKWERIARIFSRNYDVRVELSGYHCHTDGEGVIRIPANADHLTDDDQQELEGCLDHEWLHVYEEREAKLRRDAGAKVRTPMELVRVAQPRERLFMNVFEDVRIEEKAVKIWPGVAENLDHTMDAEIARNRKKYEHAPMDPWWGIGAGLFTSARGRGHEWLPEELRWVIENRAADLIERSRHTHSAEDSLALSQELLRRLDDLTEELEQEKEDREDREEECKGGAGEGSAGEDEDGSDGGSKGAEGDDLGGEESEEEDDGDDGDDSAGSGDGDGDDDADREEGGSEAHSGEVSPEVKELSDAELDRLQTALKAIQAEDSPISDLMAAVKKRLADRAYSDKRVHKRWVPDPRVQALDRYEVPEPHRSALDQYKRDRAVVSGQIHALKSKLLMMLRARALDRHVPDMERGGLDESALYSLRTGNKRVFRQRTPGMPVNVAMSLLVDLSGSMGSGHSSGTRAYYAKLTAIALAETLHAIQVPFECIGFHNPHEAPLAVVETIEAGGHYQYSRWLPFEFHVFKGFGEELPRARARFTQITGREENVDGEALLITAKRLAVREEARKMLFVLSDGVPLGGGHQEEMNAHLAETVRRVTRAGVEVCGIGLQTKSVERFYGREQGARCVVVNEIDKLAVTVYRLFKSRMLEAA